MQRDFIILLKNCVWLKKPHQESRIYIAATVYVMLKLSWGIMTYDKHDDTIVTVEFQHTSDELRHIKINHANPNFEITSI